MKIDYFCFSVPCLGTTDYSISENDDENTIWIKTKEQELMDAAKERDMLIVFDRNTKKFYIDSEEIEIRDKVIFEAKRNNFLKIKDVYLVSYAVVPTMWWQNQRTILFNLI